MTDPLHFEPAPRGCPDGLLVEDVSARFHLRSPTVNRLDIEAPVAAYPEGWQLVALEQPVNGRRMDAQVGRNVLHCHHSLRDCVEIRRRHSRRHSVDLPVVHLHPPVRTFRRLSRRHLMKAPGCEEAMLEKKALLLRNPP